MRHRLADAQRFAHCRGSAAVVTPWKTGEIPQRVTELFGMTDYDARIEAYKQLVMDATDQGVTMPLLQSVLTVAYRDSLEVPEYKNGWILANKITRS